LPPIINAQAIGNDTARYRSLKIFHHYFEATALADWANCSAIHAAGDTSGGMSRIAAWCSAPAHSASYVIQIHSLLRAKRTMV